MGGVYLLFTVGLITVHWCYVVPFYIDDWVEKGLYHSGKSERWFLGKFLATVLCFVPPAYGFLALLVFLNTKAKAHKAEKERLKDEVIG